MKTVVVDASVAVKWFVPELDSAIAMQYLDGHRKLVAPGLIHAEIANVMWKLRHRGLLERDAALGIVAHFLSLPLEIHHSESIIAPALEIALATKCTVYDCLYLALAIDLDAIVVTADRRWVNSLKKSPFADFIRLLEQQDEVDGV